MKLRVDVEPLSEARWKRVDAAVQAAIDSGETTSRAPVAPRRRLRFVWFGIAAAALVAGLVVGLRRAPAPVALPSAPSAPAPAPSHVETGDAHSRISLGFASLDIGPETSITTIGAEETGIVVVLERGTVGFEVAPRGTRPPFVVQSGDIRVRVVGTSFLVSRTDSGTKVAVSHGVVEVLSGADRTELHAGESWPRATTVAAASREPTAARSAPGPSDQQLYERAARLEGKDPDEAVAIYRRLAAKGGPWSANALFAAGRLSVERGRKAEARQLLQQYLVRYPGGANAEDARVLLAGLP